MLPLLKDFAFLDGVFNTSCEHQPDLIDLQSERVEASHVECRDTDDQSGAADKTEPSHENHELKASLHRVEALKPKPHSIFVSIASEGIRFHRD